MFTRTLQVEDLGIPHSVRHRTTVSGGNCPRLIILLLLSSTPSTQFLDRQRLSKKTTMAPKRGAARKSNTSTPVPAAVSDEPVRISTFNPSVATIDPSP